MDTYTKNPNIMLNGGRDEEMNIIILILVNNSIRMTFVTTIIYQCSSEFKQHNQVGERNKRHTLEYKTKYHF